MEEDPKTKIIKYVVKNSHYGETKDVLNDLNRLVDGFDASSENIANLCREHNEEHLALLQDSTGYSFVLSPAAYDDGGYIDQKNKKKVFVDHIEQKIVKVEDKTDIEVNEVFEEYRAQINQTLDSYIKDYYRDGTSGYSAITGKNLNLQNFHGCEWLSEWKVTLSAIQGQVRINSHFFEDGNVALQESQSFKGHINFTGEDKVKEAKSIIDFIIKAENEIHAGLDEIYANMKDTYFKEFRRILPVLIFQQIMKQKSDKPKN